MEDRRDVMGALVLLLPGCESLGQALLCLGSDEGVLNQMTYIFIIMVMIVTGSVSI